MQLLVPELFEQGRCHFDKNFPLCVHPNFEILLLVQKIGPCKAGFGRGVEFSTGVELSWGGSVTNGATPSCYSLTTLYFPLDLEAKTLKKFPSMRTSHPVSTLRY